MIYHTVCFGRQNFGVNYDSPPPFGKGLRRASGHNIRVLPVTTALIPQNPFEGRLGLRVNYVSSLLRCLLGSPPPETPTKLDSVYSSGSVPEDPMEAISWTPGFLSPGSGPLLCLPVTKGGYPTLAIHVKAQRVHLICPKTNRDFFHPEIEWLRCIARDLQSIRSR